MDPLAQRRTAKGLARSSRRGNHPEKISSFIPPHSSENETAFSSVSDFKQEYTTSMEVSVSEVFALPEYRLLCEFDNGTFILYNAAEWLDFPAFSPLKAPAGAGAFHFNYLSVRNAGSIPLTKLFFFLLYKIWQIEKTNA